MHIHPLFLLTLIISPSLWAQTPDTRPVEHEPPQTLEQASAMRQRAKQMNNEADAAYASEQEECYKKFLVNRCLDAAKKRRTQTTIEARKLDSAGRDFQREAKRAEVEAEEARRTANLATRSTEQKAQAETYRAEEAAKVSAREQKIAKKAQQAEAGRKKTAAEQAKRQAKEEKRAKRDAERAAKAPGPGN